MSLSALIEILSILNPSLFLLFASLASLLREAASALSGPAYRVFLDAFAKSANIGDLSAKGDAQIVLGNLLGLGLGALASTMLARFDDAHRLVPTIAIFLLFASAHQVVTFRAVSIVQLNTLNWQRLQLIVGDFLRVAVVPTVCDVNRREKLLYVRPPFPTVEQMRFGVPVHQFVTADRFAHAMDTKRETDRFVVMYDAGRVDVVLREDVRPHDLLKAFLIARRVVECAQGGVEEAYSWVEPRFPAFLTGLEKQGWQTGRLLIPVGTSRYREMLLETPLGVPDVNLNQ